jgi:saccharopine dehydrogenase-like NADP-dependent oxidoreductase
MVRCVLILGGYGQFGQRIARQLVQDGRFGVVIAGRSLTKAADLCADLSPADVRPLTLDRDGDLRAAFAVVRPWLVIDASGPFQTAHPRPYRVAEAAIAVGAHYADLSDGRAFVAGIGGLDAAAQAAGVTVLSGVSSVPCLSSAVALALADGLDRVDEVDISISASNRASVGEAVVRAILSYVGQPLPLWTGRDWRQGYGWQEAERLTYAVPHHPPLRQRWVALCDVPDLSLLPAALPGRPAARFKAGVEGVFSFFALWLASWMVRARMLPSLERLAPLILALRKLTQRFGSDRSAMAVSLVAGDQRRRWTLIAEQGDGPWIPSLACIALAKRLAMGDLAPGARPAIGALNLADFAPLFDTLRVAIGQE